MKLWKWLVQFFSSPYSIEQRSDGWHVRDRNLAQSIHIATTYEGAVKAKAEAEAFDVWQDRQI